MSTDYYTTIERDGCGHCSRPGPWTDRLFVGMSAVGWRFAFRSYLMGEGLPRSLGDWRAFLATRTIQDEYGRVVAGDDFWRLVESKRDGRAHWREDTSGGTLLDGPADMCTCLVP